jgi:hypothetical protein
VEDGQDRMHLKPEELIDLAEGGRDDSSAPHLAACAACRQQLVAARAMLASVADVDVPEPSPLFWDHLSRRVSDAVAAEGGSRQRWLDTWSWKRLGLPIAAGALAAVALAVVLTPMLQAPGGPVDAVPFSASPPGGSTQGSLAPTSTAELLSEAGSDDASLELVADLVAGLDASAADQAGLAARGSAEQAVTSMTGDELRELGRLLREELARSGV